MLSSFSEGHKSRILHPHGSNEKANICEDHKNVKRFENNNGVVGKLFSNLQRDLTCRHDNRKEISILIYLQFIKNLNNYQENNLPNALNYIRVLLATI